MIFRHLNALPAVISIALTLLMAIPTQAQLHDVLVEPNNVVYSSTTEIQDGSEHMLVASTISNEATENSLPQVRISRVKTNGDIDWEKDYAQETGWRAAHVMDIGNDTGVLIGVHPSLVNTGATRSIVMTFDLNTGAVLATAEIKENVGSNASEKGLVLIHGVYRNDKLALTGWLGGTSGLQLNEQRVAVLVEIDVPDASQTSITPNWTHAIDSSNNPDGADYDMGAHVLDVPGIGYFISGSANAFYDNPVTSGYHQAPLAALVEYDGTQAWSKVTPYWYPGEGDNEPIVAQNQRHAVASCAAVLNAAGPNNPNQLSLVQTVNWVRNRGLTTLHYHIDGSTVEARGLHLDGAYTNPSAETSLKGYSMYRRINATSDTEVIIAGYVNDPEYLDSDPDTDEKDRVPFLMAVELTGTVTADYLIDHTIYAGSPSTNYGDDFGIHAANSQQGQQPIIFHPEMMDLREAALGYGLIGHRRTHDIPTVFDPSIIHVNSAGTDMFGGLPGCIEFTHPMTIEFPAVSPFSPFIEDINLTGAPILMDTSTPSTTPTPCDEYATCDVNLTYSLVAVNCSTYTITVGNAGSTPMADLDLTFDVDVDGVIEQTGVADGSDGSGNPSFTRAYPEGVLTFVEVALNCQGLDYTQIVAINPDCGGDCTPDNDLAAAVTSVSSDLCSIEYGLMGFVTPVTDADITWTLNGTAVPAADGQWSPSFTGSAEDVAAAYADGNFTVELCATVICPDGTTNTQCLTITLTVEAPDFGLDMWLYCGEGCWGGWTGTRAAITFDMALFDLDEADYDAEVCFSDGTTLPIDLDMPMSFIKCFSGFTLFKEACLKIYEDGGIASGADPCYETCDRESCIVFEPFPFDRIAALTPSLGFNPMTCSIEAGDLPGTIEASTRVMAFNSAFPGGDDAVAFLSQFQDGEDFADAATYLGSNTTLGSYQTAFDCGYVLESAILHPVIECPDDTSGPLYWMAAAQAAGPNAIMLGAQLDAQLVSAYIPGDTYIPGDMFTPTGSSNDPDGLDVNFTDLIPIDPTLPGIGYNTWDFTNSLIGAVQTTGAETTDWNGTYGCGILQDVPDGFYYDNGVLGAAAFTLNGNTSIPITETGQVCLEDYHYLTEVTVEVFNTAALFAQEEEEYPMGEWTPNDGGEDEFPMSEWTPFTYVGAQLLTNATLEPFDSGATAEDLVIDYYDGYGDGSGPWSITDLQGNVVASGAMPTDTTSVSESLVLAPGTYTFSWDADCYSAYDNSGLQITLGDLTLVDLPPGTITPGLIETIVDVPGIIIPPVPPFSLDTLCDALFSHDPMALGVLPYSAPGTTIATENAISLGFEQFFDGFGMTYGTAIVDAAMPTFGSGHFLWTNNILAAYDMSAFPMVTEVSFNFFDGAGLENLKVNGHTLLTGELETMPTNVAPGVTMAVSSTSYPGYQTGTVVLTGNVQKLEIGGQQFAVDHICVKHDGQITDDPQDDPTDCDATCDVFTSFESLTVGERYGDVTAGATTAVAPGGLAVTSDGVPVSIDFLQGTSGAYFNFLGVESTPFGNVLWTNNLSAEFDVQSVMAETDTVCLAFRDQGGFENLSVNGSAAVISPNGYGGLTAFHGAVIGGVLVEVTGTYLGYAFEGTITLIGDVDQFSVGGQELFLDDLCISGAETACAADAAFSTEEPISCFFNFSATAVAPGFDLQWSKNGEDIVLATGVNFSTNFTEGVHEMCLTVTDPDDPNCSDTQCISVTCSGDPTELTLSGGSDLTVECDGAGNQADFEDWVLNHGGIVASTDCEPVTWETYTESVGIGNGLFGSTAVSFIAEDACGNTALTTLIFTIEDTTTPVVLCTDVTVECDGAGNEADLAAFLNSVTATDNCSDVTLTHDFEGLTSSCGGTGNATVTFTATDQAGNSASCTSTFTIEDTTPPVQPNLDAMVYQTCETFDPYSIEATTLSDDCGLFTYAVTDVVEVSGSCQATFLRTIVATDECDNESNGLVQVIEIVDEQAPIVTINCPADVIIEATGTCDVDLSPAALGSATASAEDNCDADVEIEISYTDVTVSSLFAYCALGGYTIERTWTATATDNCDNQSDAVCTQTIEVTPMTLATAADLLGDGDALSLIDVSLLPVDWDACASLLTLDLNELEELSSAVTVQLIDENGNTGGDVEDNGDGSYTLTNLTGQSLQVIITLIDLDLITTLVVDIPGFIPPCDGPPCIAFAAFSAMDLGNCVTEFQYIGTPGSLDWTVDGLPIAGGNNFTLNITPPGQLVCVTVTDANDPDCTDTFCQYVNVNCGDDPGQSDTCDVEFTHELMAFGPVAIPGPGVTVATEDGIDLSFQDITYFDGSTNFGTAEIMAAQPEAGDGQVLWLNNISAVYDLTNVGAVEQVKFEFIDYGGLENLRINGNLLVDDIDNMGGAVLGGVNVFVAYNSYLGFIAGEVVLTGNVQELAVAGQEFYIDNVCIITGDEECADTDADGICDADEVGGCTDDSANNYNPNATDDDGSCLWFVSSDDCDLVCDYATDFDSDYSGATYGSAASGASVVIPTPGYAFTSGDVNIATEYNQYIDGSLSYGFMTVETAGDLGVGRVLYLQDIRARFDIEEAVPTTEAVCFAFRVTGSSIGFWLNGTGYVEPVDFFDGFSNVPIAGCLITVNGHTETDANGNVTGYAGVMTITGDVNSLDLSGEYMWIDDLCIAAGAVAGCTYPEADNYNPEAEEDDGSCQFTGEEGCMDPVACNYNPEATQPAMCMYPDFGYDCFGNCLNDADEDGICDQLEVPGCTDASAGNYDAFATDDDGSCWVSGCTYPDAQNYNDAAFFDDGSCLLGQVNTCPTDINGDGVTSVPDLIELLGQFSVTCDE